MSAYCLAPDHYFCAADQAYVFLDAGKDRYFAFVGEAAGHFSEILNADCPDQLSPEAGKFADNLLTKGLYLPLSAGGRPAAACISPVPHMSCFASASALAGSAGSSELPGILVALVRSWALKRTRSLKHVLAGARRWKQRVPCEGSADMEVVTRLTAQFLALAPFLFTAQDACLFRSLFLMRFLADQGVASTWTFGVRLAPFGAHCWVEYEGAVLNDHLEHVAAFTPILTI
ncbi:lasso peptide biosynthesis B2 protein [Hyphomonas sp. ND6WE1B]|uniref:lasso peptide biosynthesis B2 protein n=1 Tax=Hyphomonas sp. ND6WE1B TaxID=1848191 RepID=UPI001584C79B|nr:lasso peptide biosynthesis B2 protein [Hyphomonas sp. ND6WE1B]